MRKNEKRGQKNEGYGKADRLVCCRLSYPVRLSTANADGVTPTAAYNGVNSLGDAGSTRYSFRVVVSLKTNRPIVGTASTFPTS